jgi:hypothetical protein
MWRFTIDLCRFYESKEKKFPRSNIWGKEGKEKLSDVFSLGWWMGRRRRSTRSYHGTCFLCYHSRAIKSQTTHDIAPWNNRGLVETPRNQQPERKASSSSFLFFHATFSRRLDATHSWHSTHNKTCGRYNPHSRISHVYTFRFHLDTISLKTLLFKIIIIIFFFNSFQENIEERERGGNGSIILDRNQLQTRTSPLPQLETHLEV